MTPAPQGKKFLQEKVYTFLMMVVLFFPFFVLGAEPKKKTNISPTEIPNDPKAADSKPELETAKPINELQFKMTGMVKTDYAYANGSVLSFGFDNLVAPTMAKRQIQARDSEPRSGIYPTSSLLGTEISYGTKLKGIFEADFVDVSKSSIGPETKPRVRQIYFKYTPNTSLEIFMGRTWDLFAGVFPHSFNSSAFMSASGNIGWQREQIGVWYKVGKFKFGSAIGTTGFHNDPQVKINVERNSMPTVAARIDWLPTTNLMFTTSAIGTKLKVSDPYSDSSRDGSYLQYDPSRSDPNATPVSGLLQKESNRRTNLTSGGVSFGFTWKWGSLESRGEVSYGTNLNSVTASSISQFQSTTYGAEFTDSQYGFLSGSYFSDAKTNTRTKYNSPREVTGFLSFNYEVSSQFGIGIHGGVSKITNPEVLIGADYNQLTISRSDSFQWTSNPKVMGAVRENQNYGFRMYFDPEERIRFFIQTDLFRTYYKDVERYSGQSAHISSYDPFTGVGELRDPGNKYVRSSSLGEVYSIRLGGLFRFDP
ncbi:hypothetical protein [Leptospira kanakyensis]|uniref:hypothetical protein n=1 Tax=Leptospira kanakyensis TaxID=2484968 RepID=UPI00223E6F99|nr:hypothetical protein [Leptospira kanakyensis]MCW7470492.1 hypothetical protein [Leptospira kanakyensis]